MVCHEASRGFEQDHVGNLIAKYDYIDMCMLCKIFYERKYALEVSLWNELSSHVI